MVVAVLVTVAAWLPSRAQVRLGDLLAEGTRGHAAPDSPLDVALVMELLASALSAGLPIGSALMAVGEALEPGLDAIDRESELTGPQALVVAGRALNLGAGFPHAWPSAVDESTAAALAKLGEVLDICLRTGASASTVLRAAATAHRRARRRERELEAGRLGVRLVLPLGLCALPSFVVLAVIPVLIWLAQGLLG